MMDLLLPLLMTFVAAASGFVGSFALQRRMSLVADSFTHVALPGIGLSLLANIDPLFGGIAALLLGAVVVWSLEEKSKLPAESVVGIIFIFALALGAILTPQESILESLFGGVESVSPPIFAVSIGLALISMASMWLLKERLTITSLSAEISKSMGLNKSLYNFLFLLIFSITIILGMKFLGVLMMGALIIIPAAIAKLFSWNQSSDIILSQAYAIVSVNIGFFLSQPYGFPLGPTIAVVCFSIFMLGILIRQVLK